MLDGIEVSRLFDNRLTKIRSYKIGFVFQSFNLIARTTAIATLIFLWFTLGRELDAPRPGWLWSGSVLVSVRNICLMNCPAASSSGWPSRGR